LGLSTEITFATVDKVAHLAKLSLSEEELLLFQGELQTIVDYVGILGEFVDHSKESMESMESMPPGTSNSLREDFVEVSLSAEKLLPQAPQVLGKMFIVPKVVGRAE